MRDLIFILPDPTVAGKTTPKVPPETKQAPQKERDEDSGSDYGGDWSGDEWNDAQVELLPYGFSSFIAMNKLFTSFLTEKHYIHEALYFSCQH